MDRLEALDQAESARLTALSKPGSRALFHNDGGSLAIFAEMVTSLDASIGKVLHALRRSGQEQDTVVVFGSDNGGARYSYQWPLRDAKGSLSTRAAFAYLKSCAGRP